MFEHGTTVLEARARSGWTSTPSAAAGASAGAARSRSPAESNAKHGITSTSAHLTPADEVEARYAARAAASPQAVGSGAGPVVGDLVIDVPPESQLHRQMVRKEADSRPIEIDPVVRLYYVEVDEPELGGSVERPRRLPEALAASGASRPSPSTHTCSRRCSPRCGLAMDGRPSPSTTAPRSRRSGPASTIARYGVAFDVGSTTVAGHLCDLATGEVLASAGEMNPQIRFGEDLMSRVSYVMLHPGGEGADEGRPRAV